MTTSWDRAGPPLAPAGRAGASTNSAATKLSHLSLGSPPMMGFPSAAIFSPLRCIPAVDKAAVTVTDLISISTEPVTLSTIPAETRLNIYHHLIPEIKLAVRQKPEGPAQSGDPSRNNIQDYYSVESISLLLVSKKIHSEVKPIVDAAPLVIAGLGVETFITPSLFPIGLLSRVHKIIIFHTRFECLNPRNETTGLRWSQNLRTPRLRNILIESPLQQTRFFPEVNVLEHHDVEFPVKILHHIAQWLYDECTHRQLSTEIEFVRDDIPWRWREAFDLTETVIQRNHVSLKSRYRCEITAKDPITWNMALMETFDAIIVWNPDGWRIEELPDLRDKWWWNRWLAHVSAVEESGLHFSLTNALATESIRLKPQGLEWK